MSIEDRFPLFSFELLRGAMSGGRVVKYYLLISPPDKQLKIRRTSLGINRPVDLQIEPLYKVLVVSPTNAIGM